MKCFLLQYISILAYCHFSCPTMWFPSVRYGFWKCQNPPAVGRFTLFIPKDVYLFTVVSWWENEQGFVCHINLDHRASKLVLGLKSRFERKIQRLFCLLTDNMQAGKSKSQLCFAVLNELLVFYESPAVIKTSLFSRIQNHLCHLPVNSVRAWR